MDEIKNNVARVGCVTSSEVVALVYFGTREMTEFELKERPKSGVGSKTKTIEDPKLFSDAGITYILECNTERRLNRSITDEVRAKATSWGSLVEKRVDEILGIDYRFCSNETITHDYFDFWSGSPDAEKFDEGKTVGEVKVPLTLKSFCTLVDPLYNGMSGLDAMNAIRVGWTDKQGLKRPKHTDGEKYYWQIVSNSILLKTKYAELIVYCPYKSELESIRELARNSDEGVMSKYYWIHNASDDELPYLIEGGYYKNLNVIRFEIPQADKDFLTQRVAEAGKLLIPFQSPVTL